MNVTPTDIRKEFQCYVDGDVTLKELYSYIFYEVHPFHQDDPAWEPEYWEVQTNPYTEQHVKLAVGLPEIAQMVNDFLLRCWELEDFPELGEDWVKNECRKWLNL